MDFENTEFTSDGQFNTKQSRITELAKSTEEFPESYRSNSHKEELCLKYTENFLQQLYSIFPDRPRDFVTPVNECGVPKLVCTTIRPTQLPYKDVYDAEACAKFVSQYITYEPLENPIKPPEILPSPIATLKWQFGDSFDMATILCSYLIGVGYDAYCVCGYAPKQVTLRDTSLKPCILPDAKSNTQQEETTTQRSNTMRNLPTAQDQQQSEGEEEEPYQIIESKIRESTFQKEITTRKQKLAEEISYYEELEEEIREMNSVVIDPHENNRVHCWVLVRAGKRMVEDNFFLEPTTGERFSVRDSPYLGIQSVWNSSNYWVNVNTDEKTKLPKHISYNLSNTEQWEYIFYDINLKDGENNADSDDSDLEDDVEGKGEDLDDSDKILDLPTSWVSKLVIPRESYRRKYGLTGRKVELLWKAKRECYTAYLNPQGIITRIFLFEDKERTVIDSVHEYFQNRRDKLVKRVRYPQEGRVVEEFLEGRPSGLQKLTEIAGKYREYEFYTAARLDGLVRREEKIANKIVEIFRDRDDWLTWRSVTVNSSNSPSLLKGDRQRDGDQGLNSRGLGGSNKQNANADISGANVNGGAGKVTLVLPSGQLGELTITKITEKFARDPSRKADDCIAKRTYYVEGGFIRVLYHYEKGRVTRSSKRFYKDRSIPPQVSLVDAFAPPIRASQLEEEFQDCLQAEKDCYQSVRDSEREAQDILALRRREEQGVILEKSVFDTARERAKEDVHKECSKEVKEEKDSRQVDYLTPFLPQDSHGALTSEEAEASRDACLRALKERLLERANIIQRRLDEENMQLAKKQAAFQRSREHVEGADEEFEKFCSEAMFRIQILEQRLARHEETALQKYADMDHILRNDPRLASLYQ